MSDKLKTILYTLTPLLMLFLAWIIDVIVNHNVTSDNNTTRVLYLTLNCFAFLIQGLIMALTVKTELKNAIPQMIISGCLAILLFIIFFNLTALSFDSIPESISDFLSDYNYLAFIWSGVYFFNFFSSYKRAN